MPLRATKGKKNQTKVDIEGTASATAKPILQFSEQEATEIRRNLLEWYDLNHRVLPWRRNPHSKLKVTDPNSKCPPADLPLNEFMYYVWVCEVMSQQTQLPRVIEYFNRWTEKWPTVEALAKASLEEVNAMWAGLGYYRRARYLLEGAKYVMEHHDGVFPKTSKELQKIPGVGAYTGNAIASITCSEGVAVVDANVVRVIARLRRMAGDPRAAAKEYAALADALLDPERPGCFNQAVMELGATVCTVHQPPNCTNCPIKGQCLAYAAVEEHRLSGGDPSTAPNVMAYPEKVEKAKRSEVSVAVCVFEVRGLSNSKCSHFLLVQRPLQGLLAGLWEFPSVTVPANAIEKERRSEVDSLLDRLLEGGSASLRMQERKQLGSIVHIFSHIRMTLHVERLVLKAEELPALSKVGGPDEPQMRWVTDKQLEGEGLSSSVCKVAKLAAAHVGKEKKGIKRFFAVVSE
ncbi:Adenine DNA glycosylase [Coccomyxa sp. Obi]|nr:Adenine DNA glycosylase [Coccomyxa sp. Obi]